MKKLIFVALLSLFASTAFGQSLQKGNLIGFHDGRIIPNPDVTMNQCISFFKDKYFPAVEKTLPGVKCYILKGIRGEAVESISMVYIFPSDEVRNKYWKEEGVFTELGNSALKSLEPLNAEMQKLCKLNDKYTDWLIL